MNVASAVSFVWDTKPDFPSVLMSQSLIYRYKEAFQTYQDQRQRYKPKPSISNLTQSWQVLIKVAASRNRITKRCGFAFETRRMDGALTI